ncbi:hypothetical protein ACLOJK_014246 [Asimina triloba]
MGYLDSNELAWLVWEAPGPPDPPSLRMTLFPSHLSTSVRVFRILIAVDFIAVKMYCVNGVGWVLLCANSLLTIECRRDDATHLPSTMLLMRRGAAGLEIDGRIEHDAAGQGDGFQRPAMCFGVWANHDRAPVGAADERGVLVVALLAMMMAWVLSRSVPLGLAIKIAGRQCFRRDLKTVLIGDREEEMHPTMHATAILSGLRSRQIRGQLVIADVLDCLDRGGFAEEEGDAAAVARTAKMTSMSVGTRRIWKGLSSPSFFRGPIVGIGRGRRTAAVTGGGDGAPNFGALAVHELPCTCGAFYAIKSLK